MRRAALDCVVHSRGSSVFGGHGRLLRTVIHRLGTGCNRNATALRVGSRCTGVHRIIRPIVCIVSVTYRTVHRMSIAPGVGPVHNNASNTRLSFGKLPYPGVFTNKIGFRDHCRFMPIRSVRGTVVAVIGVTRVITGQWSHALRFYYAVTRLPPLVASLTLVLLYTNIVALLFGQLGRPLILKCVITNFLTDPCFRFAPSMVSRRDVGV